ncbi:MAG: glycosyltransferase family 4 protein [gamma proteobacterium symbiont of Taylorina sp.]|nr:glycosyltransferase family 4 protein [gamma proteobacterium symbiont of Taylorina sp.]
MKILIVNSSDMKGGAARAAYRLHKSLLDQKINSQMLVKNKISDDYTVISPGKRIHKIINDIRSYLDSIPANLYKNRAITSFSAPWFPFNNIVNKINNIKPDIVHLHWINDSMLRIEDIAKIKAPIVWTCHDDWVFTGGCHIKWECTKYKKSCGSCQNLGSNKDNDLSRKVFNRKQKTFSKIPSMRIIGLSRWLTNCASESSLLKNKEIINIPNPINTEQFKPFDKEQSRILWGFPKEKKLILFGAELAISDVNKGFKELSEALRKLKSQNIEFIIFGSSQPKKPYNFGFKTHYLGHLHDDISLVTLYSAVDVMIVPSLQEAFGQTASESMACGTPVVAFAHSGLLDIIEHEKSGYLAKPFNTDDLANGIDWVLNTKKYDELCKKAREKIIKVFDSKIVVHQYIKLYKQILN